MVQGVMNNTTMQTWGILNLTLRGFHVISLSLYLPLLSPSLPLPPLPLFAIPLPTPTAPCIECQL